MAWLPMYLLEEDVVLLNHILCQETELAFLIGSGSDRQIAKAAPDISKDLTNRHVKHYTLWHVPVGPLPPIPPAPSLSPSGWKGTQLAGMPLGESGVAAFSPDPCTGYINLEINLPQRDTILISSFGWIGNHYREIGYPAHPTTSILWQRLRRLIRKYSVQIPRGNKASFRNEIFAFPEAHKAIRCGHLCQV